MKKLDEVDLNKIESQIRYICKDEFLLGHVYAYRVFSKSTSLYDWIDRLQSTIYPMGTMEYKVLGEINNYLNLFYDIYDNVDDVVK